MNLDPDAGLDPVYYTEEAEPDWYKTNIPCQVGCPAHTDVANYIGLISQGRFDEAYVLNRQSQRRARRAGPHLRAALRAGLPPQQD